MKKIILVFIALCWYIVGRSQQNGIHFIDSLTWEQVKVRAKDENKFIFLDCFATWCVPCKYMDKKIYSNDKVGDFLNDNFISVKVQFDKTPRDNLYVQKWYDIVAYLNNQYEIKGFPTYLFFSPDGKIVHQDMSAKSYPEDFIKVAQAALDPAKQYYTLIGQYKENNRTSELLLRLALAAKNAHNYQFADSVVSEYIGGIRADTLFSPETVQLFREFRGNPNVKALASRHKDSYLNSLTREELCLKQNLDFISLFPFVLTSYDPMFKMFFHHPEKANAVMKDTSFSQNLVWSVIEKEEVNGKLYKDGKPITNKPDWSSIKNSIRMKYGDLYAEKITPDEIAFFKTIQDWRRFAELFESKMSKYPPEKGGTNFTKQVGGFLFGDEVTLNENAWLLFLKCPDKSVIRKAVQWSELSIKLIQPQINPQFLDTKANLLYKLGKTIDAIKVEKDAINAELANAIKENEKPNTKDFEDALQRMEKGIATWN